MGNIFTCFSCFSLEKQKSFTLEKKLRVETGTLITHLFTYTYKGMPVLFTGHLFGEINTWNTNNEDQLELLFRFGTHPGKITSISMMNKV